MALPRCVSPLGLIHSHTPSHPPTPFLPFLCRYHDRAVVHMELGRDKEAVQASTQGAGHRAVQSMGGAWVGQLAVPGGR